MTVVHREMAIGGRSVRVPAHAARVNTAARLERKIAVVATPDSECLQGSHVWVLAMVFAVR